MILSYVHRPITPACSLHKRPPQERVEGRYRNQRPSHSRGYSTGHPPSGLSGTGPYSGPPEFNMGLSDRGGGVGAGSAVGCAV